jgi:hypothetical protein
MEDRKISAHGRYLGKNAVIKKRICTFKFSGMKELGEVLLTDDCVTGQVVQLYEKNEN